MFFTELSAIAGLIALIGLAQDFTEEPTYPPPQKEQVVYVDMNTGDRYETPTIDYLEVD